jgi:anti-sigma regulatory factor (Ser/Thr protein kinase)
MESFTLPAEPASVAAVRASVATCAEGRVDVQMAVLLASELVTNVVLHARTDMTIQIRPGPPFRVEVHDGIAATKAFRDMIANPPPAADVQASGGRGIGLVHSLAARLGLDDDDRGGKVVWFEL